MAERDPVDRKIVKRSFNLETGTNIEFLFNLTTYNEESLRRLWLLAQYQHYHRSEQTFRDAIDSLKQTFKRNNKVTQTYWAPPTRKQILGRRRETKIKEFLEFSEYIKRNGFDIFRLALTAEPTELIFGNRENYLPGLGGSRLKISGAEWHELEMAVAQKRRANITVSLPQELEDELRSARRQISPAEEDELVIE